MSDEPEFDRVAEWLTDQGFVGHERAIRTMLRYQRFRELLREAGCIEAIGQRRGGSLVLGAEFFYRFVEPSDAE